MCPSGSTGLGSLGVPNSELPMHGMELRGVIGCLSSPFWKISKRYS